MRFINYITDSKISIEITINNNHVVLRERHCFAIIFIILLDGGELDGEV